MQNASKDISVRETVSMMSNVPLEMDCRDSLHDQVNEKNHTRRHSMLVGYKNGRKVACCVVEDGILLVDEVCEENNSTDDGEGVEVGVKLNNFPIDSIFCTPLLR